MSILNHFALTTDPRPVQVEALNWLVDHIDKKYFFLQLAVGSGKSVVGVTFANYLKSLDDSKAASYIITPQKILQKQYEDSFKGDNFTSLYGKSNYSCASHSITCDIGSLIKPRCQRCPHQQATYRAQHTDHVVMNYALALSNFAATNKFDARRLMVFDECHQLETLLTEYNNITITENMCNMYKIKFPVDLNAVDAYAWIGNTYYAVLVQHYERLSSECDELLEEQNVRLSPSDLHKLKQLAAIGEQVEVISNFIDYGLETISKYYILAGDATTIKFKHIYGADNFCDVLLPKADKFMFLSATIFDHEELCRNLHIPIEEACFLSMDSDFHADDRPVIYNPIMKMAYGWDKSNDKIRMIKAINTILANHKDESGIIHTGNFAIAKWLVSELQNTSHNIYHHNPGSGDKRDKVIAAYLNSKKPSLLISPSISEGLDLHQDLGRFVVFAKVSFGSLADPWIVYRMGKSQLWYLLTALTDVFQGCGRVVRSQTDFGVVYILDSSWGYLFKQTKRYIPKWWLDAYHEI